MKKRFFTIIIILSLAMSIFPFSAFAEEVATCAKCGQIMSYHNVTALNSSFGIYICNNSSCANYKKWVYFHNVIGGLQTFGVGEEPIYKDGNAYLSIPSDIVTDNQSGVNGGYLPSVNGLYYYVNPVITPGKNSKLLSSNQVQIDQNTGACDYKVEYKFTLPIDGSYSAPFSGSSYWYVGDATFFNNYIRFNTYVNGSSFYPNVQQFDISSVAGTLYSAISTQTYSFYLGTKLKIYEYSAIRFSVTPSVSTPNNYTYQNGPNYNTYFNTDIEGNLNLNLGGNTLDLSSAYYYDNKYYTYDAENNLNVYMTDNNGQITGNLNFDNSTKNYNITIYNVVEPTPTPPPTATPAPTSTPTPTTSPTPTQTPGGGGTTPTTPPAPTQKPSGGDKDSDKGFGIGNIFSGLGALLASILNFLWFLISKLLAFVIWLISQIGALVPFVPVQAIAVLAGGAVIIVILSIIKFLRG